MDQANQMDQMNHKMPKSTKCDYVAKYNLWTKIIKECSKLTEMGYGHITFSAKEGVQNDKIK